MRKATLMLLTVVAVIAGCAAPAAKPERAAYPAWLEMKEGYAQACAAAGKCTPMTDAEMMEFASKVQQMTLQQCSRRSL